MKSGQSKSGYTKFAQPGVLDPVIGADQLHGLAPGKQIGFERRRPSLAEASSPPPTATCRGRGKVLEEKRNRHVQGTAQVEQPARADTVNAALVFLDLLEGEPDGLAELCLANAKQIAAQAHPGTDMDVDGVGAAAGNLLLCASANTLWSSHTVLSMWSYCRTQQKI